MLLTLCMILQINTFNIYSGFNRESYKVEARADSVYLLQNAELYSAKFNLTQILEVPVTDISTIRGINVTESSLFIVVSVGRDGGFVYSKKQKRIIKTTKSQPLFISSDHYLYNVDFKFPKPGIVEFPKLEFEILSDAEHESGQRKEVGLFQKIDTDSVTLINPFVAVSFYAMPDLEGNVYLIFRFSGKIASIRRGEIVWISETPDKRDFPLLQGDSENGYEHPNSYRHVISNISTFLDEKYMFIVHSAIKMNIFDLLATVGSGNLDLLSFQSKNLLILNKLDGGLVRSLTLPNPVSFARIEKNTIYYNSISNGKEYMFVLE